MRNKLTFTLGVCFTLSSFLTSERAYSLTTHNSDDRVIVSAKSSAVSLSNFSSSKKKFNNKFSIKASSKTRLNYNTIEAKNVTELSNSNAVFYKADSFYNASNETKFLIKYAEIEKGVFKYKTHIEGCIKVKDRATRLYVSLNSAVVPDQSVIVPTNNEGYFSSDIDDDSIGSISIIKRGFSDKVISLKNINIEKNNVYAFDLKIESEKPAIAKTNKMNSLKVSTKVSTDNKKLGVDNATQIYFDFNKSTLKEETKVMLNNVIASLQTLGTTKSTTIDINGFADKKGSREYNLYISKMRSMACKKYLEEHGLKNIKININAKGNITTTNDILEAGEEKYDNGEKDRRVDVIIHSSYGINLL